MKRKTSILLLLLLVVQAAWADKYTVSGTIKEQSTGETLPGAAIVLLNPKDSAQVTGVVTDVNGAFNLTTSKSGTYLVRFTFMGYLTQYKTITLSKQKPTVALGTIALQEDAKVMKEAQVTAKLAQVEMVEDTFVYNADAYRLPEGSTLEELVKKLPGAEVSDDGTITINGKTVTKIMVEGKEFFDSDTQMAMKNLPSKMVKKIKSYDRQSDYTRLTGIDDGEEETVLDLDVQKGMKEGWLINLDFGGGTEDRYTLKANVNRFTDNMNFSVIGSRNNVGDAGFPGGGGGFRGGAGGITTSEMAGVNLAWENGKKEGTKGHLKLGGNVRYSGTKTTSDSETNSETFLTDTTSTFSNSRSHSVTHSRNVNANMRFEWQADSLTNIMFRPNFSHSYSDSYAKSLSATFNDSPYDAGMSKPLDEYEDFDDKDSIRVNSNQRINSSTSKSTSGNANLQLTHRFMVPGRTLSVDFNGSYSKSYSTSFSNSLVKYYQTDSETYTYQKTTTPSMTYSYQGRISYSEPLFAGATLQLSYQLQRRFQDQNRTMLTIEDIYEAMEAAGVDLDELTVNDLYQRNVQGVDLDVMVRDLDNSQYATYRELNHNGTAMFRYNNKFENGQSMQLNAGVSYQPQTTHMDYQKGSVDTTIVRMTKNWSPRVDMRWKISNSSQLRLRYNGNMSQPSMTNLIEVLDTSDPLNISTGNSGLKSSWSDNFNAFYNAYNTEKQRGWAMNFNGAVQRRSISNATIYDSETGAKYARPMNIDGNWNAGGMVMFNTALGQAKRFNLMSNSNLRYTNAVGYISSNIDDEAQAYITDGYDLSGLFSNMLSRGILNQSTTKTTNVSETLRLNYRDELGANQDYNIDLGLTGGVNYQHARNAVQTSANLDTWTYNYGGNVTFSTPFNLSFSSDIQMQCRRGYEDASMNTDELIWNAQLSQSLKKWLNNHDLTISVQWYDILGQRSNISRTISATMRSDSYTNAINSYLMVHLIYKLNLLGNKEARGMMGGPGGGGFGGPGGGGPGGGPMERGYKRKKLPCKTQGSFF